MTTSGPEVLIKCEGCGATLTTSRHGGAWRLPVRNLVTWLEEHRPCRERVPELLYVTVHVRERD